MVDILTVITAGLPAVFAIPFGATATQPAYTDADLAFDLVHKGLLRQAAITSIKGDAELTFTAGGDSQTFRVGFARVPPDKARLEVVGLLGEILFVLTADGDRMMAYSKAERTAVVCTATRENLTALLGMDLGGDIFQVLDWIEGRAPMYADEIATGELSASAEENNDGTTTVTWKPRETNIPIQILTFDGSDGRVIFSRVFDADGKAETDIRYGEFKDVAGYKVPFRVDVSKEDSTLGATFGDIKLNGSIKDRAFSTEPPDGTDVHYWDDLREKDEGPGDGQG